MVSQVRYPEVDALRGLAIVLMIVYHLAFDLMYFGNFNLDVLSGGWKLLARTSAILFLLLVGVSFAISFERSRKQRSGPYLYMKYVKRGAKIFAFGMLISFATYFIDPYAYVKFGILHLIGVSTLLLPLFFKFKTINMFLAFLLLLPVYLPTSLPASVNAHWAFPFGFPYPGFQSLDYFPLIPWFGVIMLGLRIGQKLYVEGSSWRSQFFILRSSFSILPWLGRNSLPIYLLHQPFLFLALSFLGLITIN